jgi:hypothetical protein
MSVAAAAGVTAGIIDFVSFIPYILSILKGKTKPSRTSFGIWSVVSTTLLASYFASGARNTIWFILSYTIMQFVVFALSFKCGMGGLSKLDILCTAGAFIGIALWIITKNPLTALYISLTVEVIGFLPTFRKSYLHPHTENTLSWSLCTVGAIVNLFAITSYALNIALYPFAILACDALVASLLLFPRRFRSEKLVRLVRMV